MKRSELINLLNSINLGEPDPDVCLLIHDQAYSLDKVLVAKTEVDSWCCRNPRLKDKRLVVTSNIDPANCSFIDSIEIPSNAQV